MIKKIIIAVIALAILAFLWWTVSPLFIDKVVEDELDPEIAALLNEENASEQIEDTDEPISQADLIMPALEAKGIDIEAPILRDSENEGGVPDVEQADAMPEETSSSVRGPFPIVDTPGHGATGNIRVIETAEQSLVRYENYD